MNRRNFLKTGLFSSLALPARALAMGRRQTTARAGAKYATPTFVAFLDTIIPGAGSDPEGGPGALEAGTLEYLERVESSKLFPISIDVIHFAATRALDTWAALGWFKTFPALDRRARETCVRQLQFVPGVPFLLRLARAPFYTGAINRVGFDWVGYPGPNTGYADFSFRQTLARPEPGSVEGNLP